MAGQVSRRLSNSFEGALAGGVERLEKISIGSIAERIVYKVPCPVFLVFLRGKIPRAEINEAEELAAENVVDEEN